MRFIPFFFAEWPKTCILLVLRLKNKSSRPAIKGRARNSPTTALRKLAYLCGGKSYLFLNTNPSFSHLGISRATMIL